MAVNASQEDDPFRQIQSDFPILRGRECVGVTCRNGDTVLYFKSVKGLFNPKDGVAVVSDKYGRLRLSIGCEIIPLIYKQDGGYHFRAKIIQTGFSLKGGGKIYQNIRIQVNNDDNGNLIFKKTDAIGHRDKKTTQEMIKHRGSYLLFDKIERAYINRKQKEIIKKRKENARS